jgi:polysaccharide export outer membrane protein
MRYLVILLIFFASSCSSKKDILFIQDYAELNQHEIIFKEILIKPDDILRVRISSQNPELSQFYSFNESLSNNTIESYQISGYLVNSEGFISLPLLGSIFVKDFTLYRASNMIKNLLKDKGLLLNASVDIKIVNSYFTVLGEVNRPGRYNFLQNNMDILQALGIAGDLTINGKRGDIKIIRKTDNEMSVNTIDLTSIELLNSDNFQVFPNDIIIVNPNNARVKNAGVIGNSGNLLSVLSFILSSLILLTSTN